MHIKYLIELLNNTGCNTSKDLTQTRSHAINAEVILRTFRNLQICQLTTIKFT